MTIPFDLKTSPIQSFRALSQERAQVFENKRELASFRSQVEGLGAESEERRRKGLGSWMLGDFEAATELLAPFDDVVSSFTRAQAFMALGRPGDAEPIFERLSGAHPDEARPRGGWLEAGFDADLASKGHDEAIARLEKRLGEAPAGFAETAEGRYLRGRIAEARRDFETALDEYSCSREADPTHRANLFRLAHLSERSGLDDLSLECYQELAAILPIDKNVLMNLGILYEDLGRDQDAAACYDTVVQSNPLDRRARLFLEDAVAGMDMYYDEEKERKESVLDQILRIPITDFELSVRSRNSLAKMEVLTLGDLTQKSEADLLAFKNFGETSLQEVKEILSSRGLRLGMDREEAAAGVLRVREGKGTSSAQAGGPGERPIGSLSLSIRARRAVENLGCQTLGEVAALSEEQLLAAPNFGSTSLLELKQKLAEHGMSLAGKG